MTVLEERWRSLGNKVNIAAEHQRELIERYRESHRAYHNLQHVKECLDWFDKLRDEAEDPLILELAIWYHDAVYDPRGLGNEDKSASLARTHLVGSTLEPGKADAVARLILWTTHTEAPAGGDATLIVDIDLAILGAPADRFQEYESQVREEYSWVPDFIYKRKRASILRSFLERPHIYSSRRMRDALEDRARSNLRESLSRLVG